MNVKMRAPRGEMTATCDDYLDAALQIYDWIEAHKIRGNAGIYYEINPGGAEDYTGRPVHGRYGLYSGSAGIGFFLIRLYEVTGDEKYLTEVREILNEFIENVPGAEFYLDKLNEAPKSDLPVTGWHTGVYSGPLGAGIFALAAYKHLKEERCISFARKLGDDVVSASVRDENGLHLTTDSDVFSDGGFVLYFISLYHATGVGSYLDIAKEYARCIANRRVSDGHGGSYYKANDLSKVGFDGTSVYPGFAHGTSGIGFMQTVLYKETHEDALLTAARESAVFLESIADEHGDGLLIPYIWDENGSGDHEGKYYLGFCHGPAGTSLLFRELYEVTGEKHYMEVCEKLARGIVAAGAPEYHSWGFWNSCCACCGTPGLIEYFTELHEYAGNAFCLEAAKRSAVKSVSDGSLGVDGLCFYGYWDRTDPRNVQTYTGLYIGAAGVGANLLKLYGSLRGIPVTDLWEYNYLKTAAR